MWSLRLNNDNEFYLTFDRQRRFNPCLRGQWVLIGPQKNMHTENLVRVNKSNGYLCCIDDEGGVRMLVLTE